MQNDIRRGTVEMTTAMLISGTIGWFVLVSGQPVENVVFWRCVFGAVALIVICGALGYLKPGIITRRQLFIAVLGGVAIVSNWLLLFAAYPRSSISIATTVYNTQPFMLLGLGALFLGERITVEKLAWLALAFGGMMLIVQAKPGDIFICRNAGNIAPPYSDINGGVTATIEYAVAALNVRHIIVCGHSDCGAMKALLHPEKLNGLPSVRSWLKNAARAEVVVRENHPELDDAARIDALIEENVLAQLDNLRTHPCVASRLKSGSLSLHGWVYDIESGQIRVSTNQSAFLPMTQMIQNEEEKALHA